MERVEEHPDAGNTFSGPAPPATGLQLPGAETVAIVAGLLRAGDFARSDGPHPDYQAYVEEAVEILTEAYALVLVARLPDRIAERVQAAREGKR